MVYSEPSTRSAKRGALAQGTLHPLFGIRRGPGCRGLWFQVGPHAFVCEQGAEPSRDAPVALDRLESRTASGLPHEYHFVSKEGSFGYSHLKTAEDGVPEAQFQPGFGIAITKTKSKPTGDRFGLTTRGFWVPMRDLIPARPVDFQGVTFGPDLGWVVREAAPVYSRPGSAKPQVRLERLTLVRVLEERSLRGQGYVRIDDEAWLRRTDLVRPALGNFPPELRPGERWVDVDLRHQILVAYRGRTPWFATLISTGRGQVGTDSATPEGTFRIWIKLRTSDMDNLENFEAKENYAIEAVPWVMFFHQGYGLHGTFWHRRFGEVRSHGCVNLAPRDAERLFHWTSPRLPPGWTAVFPYAHEPGTLIRVRKE